MAAAAALVGPFRLTLAHRHSPLRKWTENRLSREMGHGTRAVVDGALPSRSAGPGIDLLDLGRDSPKWGGNSGEANPSSSSTHRPLYLTMTANTALERLRWALICLHLLTGGR
ncbi:hypothetical protein CFE70_001226 [Pyrenophora teres f. teres 0-1]